MQPRREREPERGDTVFQVTKRGDSTMSLARWEVRCPMPIGVNVSVELPGVVSAVEGSSEEEEEEDEEPGVEEPLGKWAARRARVGFLAFGEREVEGGSRSESAAGSASSAESSSSRPLG
jgi:hypothetical protein